MRGVAWRFITLHNEWRLLVLSFYFIMFQGKEKYLCVRIFLYSIDDLCI